MAVMDDGDMDIAAAAFGGTGQKCTASSRLVVHAHDRSALVRKRIMH